MTEPKPRDIYEAASRAIDGIRKSTAHLGEIAADREYHDPSLDDVTAESFSMLMTAFEELVERVKTLNNALAAKQQTIDSLTARVEALERQTQAANMVISVSVDLIETQRTRLISLEAENAKLRAQVIDLQEEQE